MDEDDEGRISFERLTVPEVLDAELRLRGTSLTRWAAAQGTTPLNVVHLLEGLSGLRGDLLSALARELEVEESAVVRMCRVA